MQVGVCDANHIFAYWQCHGTNLKPVTDSHGKPHKPSFHESHISGIDLVTFTEDRSKIKEIITFRCVSPQFKHYARHGLGSYSLAVLACHGVCYCIVVQRGLAACICHEALSLSQVFIQWGCWFTAWQQQHLTEAWWLADCCRMCMQQFEACQPVAKC